MMTDKRIPSLKERLTSLSSPSPNTVAAKDMILAELIDRVSELEDHIYHNTQELKIHYHRDKYKDFTYEIEKHGNFYDLAAAETMKLEADKYYMIPLGISVYLPDNYYAILLPRSSSFKKYGIMVANSMGIIDTGYRSLEDQWYLAVYATRDAIIEANERIAQFSIFKETKFIVHEEEYWEATKRGGFGSTDTTAKQGNFDQIYSTAK